MVVAAVFAAAAGCHQERVRPAPFRVRPDSVQAGTLLGPFDGKVRDSASGEPVADALVYATWSFESGYGLNTPAGFHEEVTSTDANGRYAIDELARVPDADSVRLASFHMVIYKRGYVAYRSDRRFQDLGPRHDFTQHQNEVTLERWRSDYSHVRHLRYVGGGPAIASLTAWEADEAAAELSGRRGVAGPVMATDIGTGVPAATRVVAAQILTEKDIKTVTGFDGTFESGPLNDEPDTDSYSSQHFRALSQPESFDVAVRVWKLDSEGAADRYRELIDSLPAVEQTNELADKSLRASEGSIYGVGFLDEKRNIVVLITCGKAQCEDVEQLVDISRTAYQNIVKQAPVGGTP